MLNINYLSLQDIGAGSGVASSSVCHEKISMNIGGGLIASHKNMNFKFVCDMQKQKRWGSHQGVLKLKVSLYGDMDQDKYKCIYARRLYRQGVMFNKRALQQGNSLVNIKQSKGAIYYAQKSFRIRIKQVTTISLIFLSMITGEVFAGIDPVLHNNIVADLRQKISSLEEQLKLNGNVVFEVTNEQGANNHVVGKRLEDKGRIMETKDQSTSTEDLTVLEDRLFDEKIENWEFEEDEEISTYFDSNKEFARSIAEIEEMLAEDVEDKQLAEDSSSSIKVVGTDFVKSEGSISEIVQEELRKMQEALEEEELKEKEEVEAVEDILGEDLITDTGGSPADANNSTARHQEVLAERTRFAARVREDLRFGSKAVSKQIRHRLLTRDIGKLVAVSAGDEEQDQAPSYSVWSSGMFGASKQKDSSNIIGHSSKIHGVGIGGEINLSNDLMFGVSYSRLSSKIKYPSMLNSDSTVGKSIKSNTDIFSIYSSVLLTDKINVHSLASIALSGEAAKQQDIFKPRSKLLSFESHLNYKLALGGDITLIPSIGLRYEYGRVGASKEQILDSYIVHHKRSKSSTLSGEVGARVLFTPIKISSDVKLIPTLHISLEKRIVGRGANSGQISSIKDIGESVSFTNNLNQEKLSTNIGGGLIASHKNISLEFLYDLQKQRRFKSHQGVLKLKVNL